ncbi:MAG: hypothetical protein M3O32_15720 [Actinomycetota bacterium]|nr:hypothetical protein [Actinomycetota bacterium]
MTAYTVLPNGEVVRFHVDATGVTEECRGPLSGECERAHATRAELEEIDDLLAEHDYQSGRAAERGEL